MVHRVFITTLAALALLPGCNKRRFNTATTKHVAGEYVRGDVPWMWVPFERSAFLQNMLGIAPGSDKEKLVLPADHPTTQWAQFWIDRIHERLVAASPRAMANTPKPNALVLSDKSPNAFVSGGSYCFDVDVEVDALPLQSVGKKYVVLDGSGAIHLSERPAPCAANNPFKERMGDIASWLSERLKGKCDVRWDGSRMVFSSCPALVGGFDTHEKPRGIAISGSANWVVFQSGIFADTTLPAPFNTSTGGDRFVAVIAHELTHYYRTHQLLFPQEYNYWYARPAATQAGKPPRLEDSALLNDARRVVEERRPNADSIPGQKLSPQMFQLLQRLISNGLTSRFNSMWDADIKTLLQGVPNSCWAAYSLASPNGQNDYPFLLRYPSIKPANDTERQIFLDVESTYLQCANEMNVGFIRNLDPTPVTREGRQIPSSEAFPYLRIDRVVGTWANRSKADAETDVKRAGQTMAEVARNVNRFDLPVINETIKSFFPDAGCDNIIPETAAGHPLGEFIATLEVRLAKASESYLALVDKVRQAKIGFYTVEEEADSMAVEILATLGIPLQAALDSQFEGLKMMQDYRGWDPVFDYSAEQCSEMHKAGWKEPPFLGTVTDTHHGGCYRVYNVAEEIKAHNYTMGTRPTAPLAWSSVVQSARLYENSALPAVPAPQANSCRLKAK